MYGHEPFGYFDIQCLYDMFTYLTSCGYEVIYKRPINKEFPIDQMREVQFIKGWI